MRYNIEISDMHDDWCKIEKKGELIHNDASFIFDHKDNEVVLSLNYGEEEWLSSDIRKYNDLYLAIPQEKEYIENQKVYPVLTFTEIELEELLKISDINLDVMKSVKDCTNQEIITVLCTLENRPKVMDYFELLDLFFKGILYFENQKVTLEDLQECFSTDMKMVQINDEDYAKTSIYIQFDHLTEWNVLFESAGKYFLKLDDICSIFLK